MSENNAHDLFFRQMMMKKETAKDIIKNYFPKEITESMDFDTLKISKDTFIDKKNRKNESDILYEIAIEKEKTYIYLLFEHKSYDYKYTALQLLRYMYNIWDLDIKQKKTQQKQKVATHHSICFLCKRQRMDPRKHPILSTGKDTQPGKKTYPGL